LASTHGISRISPQPRSSSQSGRGRLRGTAPTECANQPRRKPKQYFRTVCGSGRNNRGVTRYTRISINAAFRVSSVYPHNISRETFAQKQPSSIRALKRKTRLQPPTRRSTSRPRDRTAEKNQTPSDLRFEPREPSLVSPRPRQKCPHQQRNLFPSTVFRNPPDPSAIPSQA
jgi:hypothetical protein